MKLYTALCFLAFTGCATTSATQAVTVGGPENTAPGVADPVRMETPAGTFLVSPGHAEDFKKLLAGEPTSTPFYAADITE